MSEDNKALIRRAYRAIEQGDQETLEGLIADNVVEHDEFPGLEPNKRGVLQFFRTLREAFPDLTMTPNDMVAEGDKVFVRVTMAGTHGGEFIGIPATGKRIEVAIGDFLRFEDGKVAEHWGVTDTGAMMQQLGVAP